jgi:hypothetical protein
MFVRVRLFMRVPGGFVRALMMGVMLLSMRMVPIMRVFRVGCVVLLPM